VCVDTYLTFLDARRGYLKNYHFKTAHHMPQKANIIRRRYDWVRRAT